MHPAIAALAVILCLQADEKPKRNRLKSTYPDGSPKLRTDTLREKDGRIVYHGLFTSFHPNGKVAEQGNYSHGLRTGAWSMSYSNARRRARGSYVDGVRVGPWTAWNEDGELDPVESCKYEKYEWVDPATRRLLAIGSVVDGRPHGEWRLYWPNGVLQADGEIRRGLRHGSWRFWHADGAFDPRMISGLWVDDVKVTDAEIEDAGLAPVEPRADLSGLPPLAQLGDLRPDEASGIEHALGRYFSATPEVRAGAAKQIVAMGQASLSFVLNHLIGLDFGSAEACRMAERVQAELLVPIAHGRTFERGIDSGTLDPATARTLVRRWWSLHELTRTHYFYWLLEVPLRREDDAAASTDALLLNLPLKLLDSGGQKKAATPEEAPVRAALDWLVRHQGPDGSWDCDGFQEQCGMNKCDGLGEPFFDAGVTALALRALLNCPRSDPTGATDHAAARAAVWLLRAQDESGRYCEEGVRRLDSATAQPYLLKSQNSVYSHAIATTAMCEAATRWHSMAAMKSAQRGVSYIIQIKNPYHAWRYGIADGDNDTSVTGWMLQALAAGAAEGIRVESRDILDGLDWVDEVTDPITGRTGYQLKGSPTMREVGLLDRFPSEESESMTAMGLVVRWIASDRPADDPLLHKGAELLVNTPPRWYEARGSIDFYYWHLGTRVLQAMGGRHWEKWRGMVLSALSDHQQRDTKSDECGSWNPIDPWCGHGGRIYATAINALTLETAAGWSSLPSVNEIRR